MGTKGGCKWSDLLLSNSARKIAFFFFEGLVWVWFALQMRKGWYRKCNWLTQSHTASQWPSWGKNPLSSVWVQMCPRGVNPTCPHTVSHHITGSQDTYQTTHKLPHSPVLIPNAAAECLSCASRTTAPGRVSDYYPKRRTALTVWGFHF